MPDANRQLLIRADAGTRMGTGHVMRCLALAQGWRRSGGRATFAVAEVSAALRTRLADEGFSIRDLAVAPGSPGDAAATLRLAQELTATWIVADGYGFAAGWQEQVRAGGVRLAVLDDYGHAERYFADLILNQSMAADPQWYAHREADSRLALGPGYALLRREFIEWTGAPQPVQVAATKVLITLGGSDPDNVTSRVIAELRKTPGIEAVLVIGGGNPHRAEIEALAGAANAARPWLRVAVDVTDMPGLMAWADVAVIAGGSTLWEIAYMGLPSLVLVLAANQEPATVALGAAGIVQHLGSVETLAEALPALLADSGRRARMSAAARRLVDGRGVERVIACLEAA